MIGLTNENSSRRLKNITTKMSDVPLFYYFLLILIGMAASSESAAASQRRRSLQTTDPSDCIVFRSALDYTEMRGMMPLEDKSLGWMDVHDWVVYDMNNISNYSNSNNTTYEMEWTVSSPTGEGDFLVMHADTRQYYTRLHHSMPFTGDWNTFATITTPLDLQNDSDVTIPIKVQIVQGGFNLRSLCLRVRMRMPEQSDDDTTTTTPTRAPLSTPSAAPSSKTTAVDNNFLPDVILSEKNNEIPVYQNPVDSCQTTVQARDYTTQQGMTVQGKAVSNLAYMDPGDYVIYDMKVPAAGQYQFHFGVISPSGEGAFRVDITNNETTVEFNNSQLPVTNDWYTTNVVSSGLVNFSTAGSHSLTLTVEQGGWNLVWWCSKFISKTKEEEATVAPTFLTASSTTATSFVHAQGSEIRDGQDNPLILRGIALGGWMAPPLVLSSTNNNVSTSEWWNVVETTVGKDQRLAFQQSWLEQFVTLADLQQIKSTGFTTIRVPLHYAYFTLPIKDEPLEGYDTWLSLGFRFLDQLMEWAAAEELYIVLDLQAAPGGQGFDPVTSYNSSEPSLWEHAENRRKTIALWQEVARRYANHPWVAGYDLLSAVDWNFQDELETRHWNGCDEVANEPLRMFYEQAVAAIRQVDDHHMIILAGNCWGSNVNGLLPFNDTNVALGFHSYGTSMVESMEPFLTVRDEFNVPLVMTQAGGGNSQDEWSAEMVRELESNEIGWLWWTWKSMNTTSSPLEIGSTTSYSTLVQYWSNDCNDIHVESAFRALMQVANNTQISKTQPIASVVEALLGTSSKR